MRCSVSSSKLSQDNRVESPIPILPLSTPDVETEKLIKMKDEEVSSLIWSFQFLADTFVHKTSVFDTFVIRA